MIVLKMVGHFETYVKEDEDESLMIEKKSYPAKPMPVVDVTGCGDVFMAALIHYWPRDAVRRANQVAGYAAGQFGTTIVPAAALGEIEPQKVLDLEDLKRLTTFHDIVFTNGCFDLLHAGRLDLLRFAKAQLPDGKLVVAINDDSSVQRLKGWDRPIIPLDQRLQVLSALEFVDFVIVMEGDDPRPMIKALKPSVLVKGSTSLPPVGQDLMGEWGGKTVVLNAQVSQSTSNIIKKIKKPLSA